MGALRIDIANAEANVLALSADSESPVAEHNRKVIEAQAHAEEFAYRVRHNLPIRSPLEGS